MALRIGHGSGGELLFLGPGGRPADRGWVAWRLLNYSLTLIRQWHYNKERKQPLRLVALADRITLLF